MSQPLTVQPTGIDEVPVKSARALTRILREIGTTGGLTAAFQAAGSTANITSCSATANIVMERISPNAVVPGRMSVFVKPGMLNFWGQGESMLLSSDALIAEMVRLLERPVALYVGIKKDHHFVVVPIDDSRLAILQGFQGSYSLADWLAWRGVGTLTKGEFRQAMLDLVSDSRQSWTAAALKLFAFQPGDRGPGDSVLTIGKVQEDIREWFDIRPYIVQYAYKEL